MGIEQSLSYCINYIYTNIGMQNRIGLFMQKLFDEEILREKLELFKTNGY
ncbi:MAG: hypothetical protein HFJ59_00885 [Clostridia bacterium]|nr:hypothetical protein [Clostridia bacterium]